ncbi:MAG: YicC/YloC family endoribonuclease [Oscillospiraceae bacterium]|jgi:uncharacterized protein (TIGR00255 family)
MIKSMTGYGGAKGSVEGLELSIEVKSVNNRYLDTTVRVPRTFIFAEEAIKAAVQKHISRGKVDVYIAVDSSKTENVVVSVNEPLLEGYITALRQITEKFGLQDDLTAVNAARFQDVLTVEKKELDKDALVAGICDILEQALNEFDGMRVREGTKLREDILVRLSVIESMISFVEERSPQTVAEYTERLKQRIREFLENKEIDESRILTEAAIFADKVAVDEETVRLRSHISQFRELIMGESPVGRKLDFLIQEFNREVNTIGSKCSDSAIARTVVDLKAEIEKIREQIQNIE